MDTELIFKIIGWVAPTVLSFIVGVLTSKYKKAKSKNKEQEDQLLAMKKGIIAMLKNIIASAHETYTRQGFCSVQDKQEIITIHKCYESLCDDGLCTALKDDIVHLPDYPPSISTRGKVQ
jgi:hypothetical protein